MPSYSTGICPTQQSPATCLFGRPTKDLIPLIPGKYHPHKTWRDNFTERDGIATPAQDSWSEHTKALTPLKIGDRVRIQNQTGNYPNKWDRTGSVVEVKQYHQYHRQIGTPNTPQQAIPQKIHPSYRHRPILEDIAYAPVPPLPQPAATVHSPPPTTLPQATPATQNTRNPPPEPVIYHKTPTPTSPLPLMTPARATHTPVSMATPSATRTYLVLLSHDPLPLTINPLPTAALGVLHHRYYRLVKCSYSIDWTSEVTLC